jgi:BirA family transcriptional regulator, biotin operon repressor / biotin---[acetyl-CoA-carboxylase] ligase
MQFPRSAVVAARLEVLDEAGSTNDELAARASGPDARAWPEFSVLVTDNQTRGRGRLGRRWLAPTGKTLAVSLLLRPRMRSGASVPLEAYGWLPLLAGIAMTDTVRAEVELVPHPDGGEAEADESGGVEVSLKWPNDVLVSGYKICGILSELLPDGHGVIVGSGLNLSLDEHDLPTLTSTSLLLATGVAPDADDVLAGYLSRFRMLYERFLEAGGDAEASGLRRTAVESCGTIGRTVRVDLPGDRELVGTAVGIDELGRLLVRDDEYGEVQSVAAGEVTHLRY